MALDLERMMILLQRRYNTIRDIHRLTEELAESFSRNDQVSVSMLLQMRADEIVKCEDCILKIWELAGAGGEEAAQVRRLMVSDTSEGVSAGSQEEKKIFEIRKKTGEILEIIRRTDRMVSGRVGGEKSFYSKNKI